MRKTMILGALGFLLALALPHGAALAGVATSGAVLLDPFDPVPEIGFRHYGGYGCLDACGGYDDCDHCGRRDHGRHYHPVDCADDCGGRHGHPSDLGAHCTQGNCYDAERYERRWRDGDRIGQEWYTHGRKEQVIPTGAHGDGWDQHDDSWHDDDSGAPPPRGEDGAPPPHDAH